ncbi:SAF domain-containing protein [Cellulomonas fengjieae]|uniref:SAF domain-containing protein n=1 Tax=Cellulomonas fengjieae TaxID=2819978 RepID=A0ABS3SID4_9CELL|nr:SAF domain-containing protein [Cellulomonas fengjieae]MBO3085511.1 hypothetical protein [Cellulomonas fengjieae]MBO3102619.1 hypothetical protein [Cellulomonas fengjieae]QVI64445.1 hypothetical protein KG102_09500 [Cellulomonas fengjieae]
MTSPTGAQARDNVTDRRRAREDRGISATGARSDRLPPAPRERRPMLAALAVLLIVGGAAVAGLLALRADERVPMLAVSKDVAAGSQIGEDDLHSVPVAADGTLLVPASQMADVVGKYARVKLSEGQLLDVSMLGDSGPLKDGMVAVGADIEPGRMPASGLQPGDIVQLVAVTDAAGRVLVPDALVSATRNKGAATTAGSAGSGITATFIVDTADAPQVAAVASSGDLSVILVTRGQPIDEGS